MVNWFKRKDKMNLENELMVVAKDEIEVAKNLCAKKLFAKLNGGNVHYDVVNSYQQLMDVMNK